MRKKFSSSFSCKTRFSLDPGHSDVNNFAKLILMPYHSIYLGYFFVYFFYMCFSGIIYGFLNDDRIRKNLIVTIMKTTVRVEKIMLSKKIKYGGFAALL